MISTIWGGAGAGNTSVEDEDIFKDMEELDDEDDWEDEGLEDEGEGGRSLHHLTPTLVKKFKGSHTPLPSASPNVSGMEFTRVDFSFYLCVFIFMILWPYCKV